ncbi:anti-sigma factor domain-containing protein [Phycisphaera mikurensis]|nr:anti-sigma factor [Phycisphaera mikurensis]MBB6442299.1 anti-sigma-K factor RskA [Phycisphaera mikurensis]
MPDATPEPTPDDAVRALMLVVVAGRAEPEEQVRAKALLDAGDPAALRAWSEAETTLAALAGSLEPVPPPPALRARLMAGIADAATATATAGGVPAAAARRRVTPAAAARGWPWGLVGGAVAAALTAAAFFAWSDAERRSRAQTIAALRAEVAAQREALFSLEADRVRLASLRTALASRAVELVVLAGTPAQPSAHARLLWDADAARFYLYARGLRPAGDAGDYQLWSVDDAGIKRSLAVFDAEADGSVALQLELPGGEGTAVLAAITDEPAGGSPQPTGSFQLLGEFPAGG